MITFRDVFIFLIPAIAAGFFAVMVFLIVDALNEHFHFFYNEGRRAYRKPVENKAVAA